MLRRLPRKAAAAVRREPLIWSAALLFALIAVVTALSNGKVGPQSPPLSLTGSLDRTRMISAERQAADAQALANQQAAPSPGTPNHAAPGISAGAPSAPTIPATATLPAVGVWPISGKVATGYGWVFDRTGGYWYYHTGWEIVAPSGSAVRAALPGSVSSVEREPSGAFTVVVRSPENVITTYTGLQSTKFAAGSPVALGATIGTLTTGKGSSGRLGFSVTRAGQPVNPASILPSTTAGASPQR